MNVVNRRRMMLKFPVATVNFTTVAKKQLYTPSLDFNVSDMIQEPTTTNQEHINYYVHDIIVNTNRE